MTMTNDAVNHPSHYNSHPEKIETIKITKHETYSPGNALKYVMRHGLKADIGKSLIETAIQDVEKAIWYLTEYRNDLKEFGFDALPAWRQKEALKIMNKPPAQDSSSVVFAVEKD